MADHIAEILLNHFPKASPSTALGVAVSLTGMSDFAAIYATIHTRLWQTYPDPVHFACSTLALLPAYCAAKEIYAQVAALKRKRSTAVNRSYPWETECPYCNNPLARCPPVLANTEVEVVCTTEACGRSFLLIPPEPQLFA